MIGGSVLTVIFTLLAGVSILMRYDMAQRGKTATARVLETHSGKYSHVVVEFTTAAGQHIRARVDGVDEKPGTIIRVTYLPDEPKNVEKTGGHAYVYWIGAPATMAVLSFVLTLGLATGRLTTQGNRIVRTR